MFGANVVMTHAAGFFDGKFEHLLHASGKIDLTAVPLTDTGNSLDDFLNALGFQPQIAQNSACNSAFFLDQAQEQVLGADRGLPHPLCFLMRQTEHPASSLGETFHSGQGNILL
jgi:hypothetical protein